MKRFLWALCPLLAACAIPKNLGPQAGARAPVSSEPSVERSSAAAPGAAASAAQAAQPEAEPGPVTYPPDVKPCRGVHLTAWTAGAPRARRKFLDNLAGTSINAVVIPLKEIDGKVYVPGLDKARQWGTQQLAIPDPAGLLGDLKSRKLYAVARIAVFKDDSLPRLKPEWAVKDADGKIWTNAHGTAWVDPYRREIWEYAVDLASHAAKLGFDEVQFDYIRFPSDGDTRRCRYSRAGHSQASATQNLSEFLRYAHDRLKPTGVKISVAIFGMTTTAKDDMGIGQRLDEMFPLVDAISPMMYPSHYGKGEYGLKNPDREPYKVIYRGIRDARRRLKDSSYKLRPYLQDFSLGLHYGPSQVRAQILAAKKHGIESWLLWNPRNRYTWSALKDPDGPSAR